MSPSVHGTRPAPGHWLKAELDLQTRDDLTAGLRVSIGQRGRVGADSGEWLADPFAVIEVLVRHCCAPTGVAYLLHFSAIESVIQWFLHGWEAVVVDVRTLDRMDLPGPAAAIN